MSEKEARKARFSSKLKINPETNCWEWKSGRFKNEQGQYTYGQFFWGTIDGKEKSIKASRAAWMLFRGDIPAGGQILHTCHNAPCCNPDHLYIGDHKQNMRDRDEAGRTDKWDKRYNFKRSNELIGHIKEAFRTGLTVAQVSKVLGIGWQTIYRCRDQDSDLKQIMAETKRARYSKAGRQRWIDGKGKGSRSS